MALDDYRHLVDLGPWGHIGVEVVDARAAHPIRLDVSSLHLELDDAAAGELFDTLAAAIRTVIGGRAAGKLHPADTPTEAGS